MAEKHGCALMASLFCASGLLDGLLHKTSPCESVEFQWTLRGRRPESDVKKQTVLRSSGDYH